MVSGGSGTIDHRTSSSGRWLRQRRMRTAIWIAVAEGILVAVLNDVTRWTVLIVAIPLIAVYWFWGRNSRSDTVRQATWIAGASQALALLFVLIAFVVGFFVLALVVIAAFVAIAFFVIDRR